MMSKKIITRIVYSVIAALVAFGLVQVVEAAGNIGSVDKWAWGTNAGWINFNPSYGGVSVCADHLEGYAWAENIGWIKMGTFSGCAAHTYNNTSTTDYGVNKDSSGNLSGNAWSTNAGWIKFNPTNGGVTINSTTGSFDGYAWAENVGWIHFKGTGSVPYNVVVTVTSVAGPNYAAVLPLSRSVQVGGAPATAFAVIINASAVVALNCHPAPPSSPPTGLGTFTYQTTTPANALSGTSNTPANIAPGAFQNYVFGFSPTAPIAETSLAMQFLCDNAAPAAQTPGVNNFFIVAATSPVPDPIALISTVSGDGVVHIPGSSSTQLFAIGTSNVGATGTIVVSGDTGGALPLTLTVCETTGGSVCLAPPTPTVTVNYAGGTNRSFVFFAQASGSIPFDPANNRVFARLRQAGVLRGATSAAVCTTPNAGC